MAELKQSIAWWSFMRGDMTPEHLVRTVADIGYAGIELVGQEHWRLIKDHGLTIVATGGHRSLENGLNRRENHAAIEREILDNIKLATEWGIPNLIVFSGNRKGLDDEQGAENTAEGLRRVARAAEDSGVTLVLELLNSKVDHPDYQCDKTPWGVHVCEMVDSPRVKLLYDIYHMQIMEGDIIRTIGQSHQFIGHYHTAGNPGRHEIDDSQELAYPAIMRAISEIGYNGFVGQEFVPVGDLEAALRNAWNICRIDS